MSIAFNHIHLNISLSPFYSECNGVNGNDRDTLVALMKIGHKLKAAREKMNLSYYKLTQVSNIPADYLKRIEESTEDNIPNISIDVLERLCNALSVPVSDFLNENEDTTYLTPKEKRLIDIFRRFGEPEQDACVSFMDLVSSKQA